MTPTHYGVDIYDGTTVTNYSALYAALKALGGGEPFIVIKATQGVSYTNPDFVAQMAGAKAGGFVAIGPYLMDEGSDSPSAEEAVFRRIAGNLPQFDDVELPGGLTPAQYVTHTAQLLAQASALPYYNQSEEAEGFPMGPDGDWEADYNDQPGVVANSHAVMHQYTSTGTIAGIAGDADLDCWVGADSGFWSLFRLPDPNLPDPGPPSAKETDVLYVIVNENTPAATAECAVLFDNGTSVLVSPTGAERFQTAGAPQVLLPASDFTAVRAGTSSFPAAPVTSSPTAD